MNPFHSLTAIPLAPLLISASLAVLPAGAQNAFDDDDPGQAPAPEAWVTPPDGAERPVVGVRTPLEYAPPELRTEELSPDPPVLKGSFVEHMHDRVHYDLREGVLWAVGNNYKVSAGGQGFAFMPFLGSDAPMTYQFRMRLESATLAGEALELTEDALVSREGDRITLERGSVDVLYDMSRDRVEQTFALNVAGGDGDLVLQINVDSDLPFEMRGEDIYYANDLGGLTYSHALVVDEAGQSLALPIEAGRDRIRLTVPASFMRRAVGQVRVDPLLHSFQVNGVPGQNTVHPDVAYDMQTNTFAFIHEVQWSGSDSDVWLVTHDAFSGARVNIAVVEITTADTDEPTVASALGQYLAVYRRLSSPGFWEIVGRTINASNVGERSPQVIIGNVSPSSSGWTNTQADVGGKSHGSPLFMVAWSRFFLTTGTLNVRSAAVTPRVPFSTTLAPTVSTFRAITNSTQYQDHTVRVSKSSGSWNVSEWRIAFIRDAVTGSDQFVYTAVIADDNTLTAQASFHYNTTIDNVDDLDISAGLYYPGWSRPVYLIVFHEVDHGSIRFRLFEHPSNSINGGLLRMLENIGWWVDRDSPAIATINDRFAVAYIERGIGSAPDISYLDVLNIASNHRLAINERRVEIASLGNGSGPSSRPALASSFSGGFSFGRYLATSITAPAQVGSVQESAIVEADESLAIARQFCLGNRNSTGGFGFITMTGNADTAGLKALHASEMPAHMFGYFLASLGGSGSVNLAGSAGILCLDGGPLGRYNQPGEIFLTGLPGTAELTIDPTALRGPGGNMTGVAGQTWNFQAWHREAAGSSNFTNACSLTLE